MTEKSVLLRPLGMHPRARAPTRYATVLTILLIWLEEYSQFLFTLFPCPMFCPNFSTFLARDVVT